MSRRVFLDVGGNVGQTLEEVVNPYWDFDRIWSFEPMPEHRVLSAKFGDRATVCPFGLLDRTGKVPVYGTNERIEASIWATKEDVDSTTVTMCDMVEAAQWFRDNICPDDRVWMKLNCEGAETLILTNLAQADLLGSLESVMIDPDIERVPGEEHRLTDLINLLGEMGFDRFKMCSEVMIGETHQDRIANWLGAVGANL